ncbi:MAG: hypothetical protein QOH64_1718 [Acidimicrobiaceae bacterium]
MSAPAIHLRRRLPARRAVRLDHVIGAGALLVAAVAGALVGRSPLLGIAAGLAFVGVAGAIVAPFAVACVGVLSLSVSLEVLDAFVTQSASLAQAEHILVVVALVPVLMRGLRDRVVPLPLLAYGVTFLVSYTLAGRLTGLNLGKSAFALVVLSIGWAAAHIRWKPSEQVPMLTCICALPLLSVVLGLVLQLGGLHQLFGGEYTGVTRLRGASIPSYVAFMATVAIAAALLLHRLGYRRGIAFIIPAGLILALTGTRGGFIATTVILLPWGLSVAFGGRPAGPVLVLRLLGVLVVTGAVLAIAVPPLVERTVNDPSGQTVDASGRLEAWQYFYQKAKTSPEFGLGLGAAPLVTKDAPKLRADFTAAHNEYLRLYVEGGVLGFVLTVGGIIVLLQQVHRRLVQPFRRDFTALCIGFALYSITDNTSYFAFFIPFGIIVGLYATLGTGPREAVGATP